MGRHRPRRRGRHADASGGDLDGRAWRPLHACSRRGSARVPGTGYNARRLRGWLAKTGGAPTLTGKDPVGQALFLKHERPEAYDAAAYLLDVPEYLTFRATGRAVAAYDTAVLRWCTDNRNADEGIVSWDPALIAACGLDAEKLPALIPPVSVVGPLTREAAEDLGVTTRAVVATGTGDTTAAAIGAGAVRDFEAHMYVGTSAWISCHVPYKKTDLRASIASLPAAVPGRYWIATVQDVAGKAIDWLIDNVLHDERPEAALDKLNALAAEGLKEVRRRVKEEEKVGSKVEGVYLVANPAGRRTYEKAGFRFLGGRPQRLEGMRDDHMHLWFVKKFE